MTAIVFDSSAVIAFVRGEPGFELVANYLGDAAMSAVNLQEVAKVLLLATRKPGFVEEIIGKMRIEVFPHAAEDAYSAAALVHATKKHGSGLGDRSCMALAMRLGVPALTTDRAWAKLKIPGLEVVVVR